MDGLFSWSRCNKLNDSAVPIPIPQLLDASIGKGREQIGRARVQQPYVPARRGRAGGRLLLRRGDRRQQG